jgi:hypothetical protein
MREAVESRGQAGRMSRALRILSNYGMVSSDRFLNRLESFGGFLRASGLPATFACPSALLGTSQRLVDFLKDFDVAIHGMDHVDYKNMSRKGIESDVRQAISEFESWGLRPRGFRAPYLRWNKDLVEVVGNSGLAYDSSHSIFWDVTSSDLTSLGEIRKLLSFYSSTYEGETPSLPKIDGSIVRIPVSLPDDEILLERMMMKHPSDLLECWLEMLEESHQKSELLVLQIHPERFDACREALQHLLSEVRKRNIWVTTLQEIASWWQTRNKVRLTVDRRMQVDYNDVDGVGANVRNETVERGESVPDETLVNIPSDHPLYARVIELGFVISSSGCGISRDVVKESEFLEIGRKKGFLQKSLWPNGHQSAFCITGDIDALSVGDFIRRFFYRERRSQGW